MAYEVRWTQVVWGDGSQIRIYFKLVLEFFEVLLSSSIQMPNDSTLKWFTYLLFIHSYLTMLITSAGYEASTILAWILFC